MKWKSGLARCQASKASPPITLRKTPPCATTKPDSRSPISSRPCAKSGMSQQATPRQRRKRPRTRPLRLLLPATDNRRKRHRARRLQRPLRPRPPPLRQNPPRLRHPRPPPPQATKKRTRRRRTRRRQHPQPLHRNLPPTRRLPRPSGPMQNPPRLRASPQPNQPPPNPSTPSNHKHVTEHWHGKRVAVVVLGNDGGGAVARGAASRKSAAPRSRSSPRQRCSRGQVRFSRASNFRQTA